MTNNYILLLLKRAIDLSDEEILKIYKLVDKKITKDDVDDVLRTENDPKFILLSDEAMMLFLDALIIWRRGKSNKKPSKNQQVYFSNNIVMKKLRIAFDLKDEDVIELFSHVEVSISKSQLSAYFRKAGHENYKKCTDSMLKNFIKGSGKFLKKSATTH